MKLRIYICGLLFLFLFSKCNTKLVKVQNENKGSLSAVIRLELTDTKKFILDSISAPKPDVIQIFTNTDGIRYLSFLNKYSNSIYFFDYSSTKFLSKISFQKMGPDGIPRPAGYYIKTSDSIYIFDEVATELVLVNAKGKVNDRISLKGNDKNDEKWFMLYPQYEPRTVVPFIETNGELIFTGQCFFSTLENIITKFKFSAQIDLKTNAVEFHHLYPKELYGSANWRGGAFTIAFPELHPDSDKLIYSFPVSHDLYITGIKSNSYKKVYAGSNFTETISSMEGNPHNDDRGKMLYYHCKQDFYTAIRYDKYRKVYYRFLWKGVENATIHSKLEEKPIAVIIMDENFNYLGETEIGTGKDWNWMNSFVTCEGLNIEYLEKDFEEVYLTFKIFTIKSIKDEDK